ncbi:MAG TPA: TolC family protein [Bryobacteraceae bacterium]|jgi:cobalt-zinc-cadmium efflux system outer membrane protein|nr:TolC family protein [Bryobacteraceae bacterium]
MLVASLSTCLLSVGLGFGQSPPGTVRITLDQAIEIAIHKNHNLLAARTSVEQNLAQEITANLRPNPTVFADWEYLPLYNPGVSIGDYLHDSTEADLGISYLFERGKKRQHRLQAARDATSVTRSQVVDNERTLTFQVAQLFINVLLAESTLDLARQDLKSFQETVNVSEAQYKVGGISQNDYLKIKIQLLQFQQDVDQADLARAQALSDLRQQVGYESVPADYDVAGAFDYQPLTVKLEDLQAKALLNRPDLRAAVQGVTAAKSQYELAKANGKQDVTGSSNYSHVNSISALTFSVSVPLPIFNRNQGEIARTHVVITQAREQQAAARGQALTDVKDAYEALVQSDRVTQYFRVTYLDIAQKSRDISEYAYRRGATPLLDFLDAERSYRAIQLAYRQALAAYLTALEQLREAVGTRSLP